MFQQKINRKFIFAKVPLSSGELINIGIKIEEDIYSLQNKYEQIYSFVDTSSSKPYELTEMSADLRNCTFSEISDPGVECFAPFSKDAA